MKSAKSPAGTGIFIRENGQTREVTREEWDEKFPGREPVVVRAHDPECIYSANITHNLSEMADQADLYECLWRPDEIRITHAAQLIGPLQNGLEQLRGNPDHFKTFNPPNGWGNYEGLMQFVEKYLAACERYPEAEVYVSR